MTSRGGSASRPSGAPAVTASRPDAGAGTRPAVVVALSAWLALAPVLQALSLAGLRVANFAPDRPWSYLAYGLAAPYVAWLVWRRHPRARFAAYVFFTHEALRGLHLRHWDAVALAGLAVLLLQLPAARRWLPSVRPAEVRARWRRGLRADGGPAHRAPPPAAPSEGPSREAPLRRDRP
jgi:hypothetical protein